MKFVDKNLAIKLKEKGFNRPCFGYYQEDEFVLNLTSIHLPFGGNVTDTMVLHQGENDIVDAPTTEQVLKWLREEKNIYVGIAYMPKIDNNTDFYYPTIQKIGDFEATHFGDNDKNFNSYEDASIAGIEYVVEHLI